MTVRRPGKGARKPSQSRKTPNFEEDSLEHALEGVHSIFKFGEEDRNGPWAWKLHRGRKASARGFTGPHIEEILQTMGRFGTMTNQEILKTGSHPVHVEKITKRAQQRLRQIMGADWVEESDELFSFRINKRARLWCIQELISEEKAIYKVLWWDPNHEICPGKN